MWSEDWPRSLTIESASGGVIRDTLPALANGKCLEMIGGMLKLGLNSLGSRSQKSDVLAKALRAPGKTTSSAKALSALT